jgi:hypothetical protein
VCCIDSWLWQGKEIGSRDDARGKGYSYCGEDSTQMVCSSSSILFLSCTALAAFFRGGMVVLDQ